MNILILTHPLGSNYGGIMQCFALQTTLQRMGHDVSIIDIHPNMPFYKKVIRRVLSFFNYSKLKKAKFKLLQVFVDQYFNVTKTLYDTESLRSYVIKHDIGAVIVGSDQVWKREFAINYGMSYFLDFVPREVKKISYAASLGHWGWRFTNEETKRIHDLLQGFCGVSVRESDSVTLCANNIGIIPEHLIDPSFLLNSSDYEPLISPRIETKKYIFVYWLWNKEAIREAVESVPNKDDYRVVELSMLEGTSFISIGDWLSYIKYADMVVTDSFHGCAFAIIFNRPLSYVTHSTIHDNRRTSLFNMLGIDPSKMSVNGASEEYIRINKTLRIRQNEAKIFLDKVLK